MLIVIAGTFISFYDQWQVLSICWCLLITLICLILIIFWETFDWENSKSCWLLRLGHFDFDIINFNRFFFYLCLLFNFFFRCWFFFLYRFRLICYTCKLFKIWNEPAWILALESQIQIKRYQTCWFLKSDFKRSNLFCFFGRIASPCMNGLEIWCWVSNLIVGIRRRACYLTSHQVFVLFKTLDRNLLRVYAKLHYLFYWHTLLIRRFIHCSRFLFEFFSQFPKIFCTDSESSSSFIACQCTSHSVLDLNQLFTLFKLLNGDFD